MPMMTAVDQATNGVVNCGDMHAGDGEDDNG